MNERKYAGLTTEDILAEAEEINFEPFSAIEAALSRLDELEKRNAILEAAVAWHGWDEVPDGSKGYFEIKYLDGTLGAGTLVICDSDVFVKMLRHGNIRLGDAHKFAIGWRYPVGDLSE